MLRMLEAGLPVLITEPGSTPCWWGLIAGWRCGRNITAQRPMGPTSRKSMRCLDWSGIVFGLLDQYRAYERWWMPAPFMGTTGRTPAATRRSNLRISRNYRRVTYGSRVDSHRLSLRTEGTSPRGLPAETSSPGFAASAENPTTSPPI